MKATFTKGTAAFAGVIAASLAVTSGCSSTHKSSSTAGNWTSPDYQETASTTQTTTTTQASTAQNSGQLTETGASSSVIPLYKEDLAVGKRTVDAGTVSVKKVVKTETVSQPVELRHEEIEIERVPAGSETASAPSGNAFQDQDTVIHLTREEPVVEKRTSMSGQVVVKTRSASEQKNIQEQVRTEDVAVVKSGNADNVNVGQNITVQQSGEATGGAESPSGQSSGQSKSNGQ
jgi:uncharacterized protein (TIGR02271 family)